MQSLIKNFHYFVTLSYATQIFSLSFHIVFSLSIIPDLPIILNLPVYLSLWQFIAPCIISITETPILRNVPWISVRHTSDRLSIARNPNYLFHPKISKLSVHPLNARFLLRQNQYRNYRIDSPKNVLVSLGLISMTKRERKIKENINA